jgi:drug/metabolite transporter (DMT)-like permease
MFYILIAAGAAGVWSVVMSRASKLVHPIVGVGMIEGSALVLVVILLVRHRVDLSTAVTPMGAALLVLCGMCVFSVDFFSLRAYEMGMELSVGAPMIAAGAILIPAVAVMFLGEGISSAKLVGVGLIGAGVLLLSRIPV